MPQIKPKPSKSPLYKEILNKVPFIALWAIVIMFYISEFETSTDYESLEVLVSDPEKRHLALKQLEMFEDRDWELNYLSNIRENLRNIASFGSSSKKSADDAKSSSSNFPGENTNSNIQNSNSGQNHDALTTNENSLPKNSIEAAKESINTLGMQTEDGQPMPTLQKTANLLAQFFSEDLDAEVKTPEPDQNRNENINNVPLTREDKKLSRRINKIVQKEQGEDQNQNSLFHNDAAAAYAEQAERTGQNLVHTTQSTEGLGRCPFEYQSEYQTSFKHVQPLLNSIRRDHYLVNISPFGPNNQLRGFRDTLLLSVYLNRTIVIPSFFKHRTDPSYQSGSPYQDGQQKIDGLKLAEFIPTITMQEFGRNCPNGLDVVYLSRISSNSSQFQRVQIYEKILGFNIINRDRVKSRKAMIPPTVINPKYYAKKTREEVYIKPTTIDAMEAYGPNAPNSNDGPCAMWQEVYRNMMLLSTLGKWATREDQDFSITDNLMTDQERLKKAEEIVALAVQHTPRPNPVRDAAFKFRESISVLAGNRSYVALHWRYDPDDFGKHCQGKTTGICGALSDGVPAIVGKNVGGSSWSRNINMERQAFRRHKWDQPNSWFLQGVPEDIIANNAKNLQTKE